MLLGVLCACVFDVGVSSNVHAQQTPTTITPISLTLAGSTTTNTYTQDFNSLASSGLSSALPPGFGFAESGSNANTTYAAGTGSDTTGNTYSFGVLGVNPASDRALGGLQSGSLIPTIGAVFTNNSGSILTGFTISYTGEQYRLGTADTNVDRLDFQYNPNVSSGTGALTLTSGYVNVDALDFSSPNNTTAGALDGNAAANRTRFTNVSVTGLNIADGQSFAIRFLDFNVTGADDGLAIDDFSLFGTVTPVPEPGTVVAGCLALAALAWHQRHRLRASITRQS